MSPTIKSETHISRQAEDWGWPTSSLLRSRDCYGITFARFCGTDRDGSKRVRDGFDAFSHDRFGLLDQLRGHH